MLDDLIAYPLTDPQVALRNEARTLADDVFRARAAQWDEREEYPWENVRDLVARGYMGMTVPPEYGGRGASLLDAILVIEAIARRCGVSARIVVDSNLGPVGAIRHFGTEAQKRKYLPKVVAGDKPAIAITEPDAGSAASEMTTRATVDGDDLVIEGTKHWITGGGVSQTYVVFCRFGEIPGAAGVGAVIVEAGTAGLDVPKRERAMGMRGIPETVVVFDRCRVPRENLIVGAGGFGRLMSAYNGQRLGASAVALGLAQGALELAVGYARERQQFGRPIAEFQGLRWMLADMAIAVEGARQMIYRTAANAGAGLPDMSAVAACKVMASETAVRVTNQALQVFGARGYSRESEIERMVRDARMFTIAGGTAEMLRNLLANRLVGRMDQRRAGAQ